MNMSRVLSILDSLKSGWYNPPTKYYQKKDDFISQAYKASAINEIILYVVNHKNDYPVFILEQFRDMIDEFACSAKSEDTKLMFSIYYDVATDVLDMLLTMK